MHKRVVVGFTLVEIIIVITIIAILAGIIAFSYAGSRNRANDTAVQSDLTKYADALNVYYSTAGRYPINQAELLTITSVQFATSNYKTTANAVLYCVETNSSGQGADMAIIAKSQSGNSYYVKDEATVTQFSGTFPSGNTTTDCQAANSAISTVTPVWVHSTGSGWLSSVL